MIWYYSENKNVETECRQPITVEKQRVKSYSIQNWRHQISCYQPDSKNKPTNSGETGRLNQANPS